MSGGRSRVLVVEDEPLIAALLEMAATEAGYDVVGPVDSADEAGLIATSERIDAAVLDIHLRGGTLSYPAAADVLAERGIPFAFVTSESPSAIIHTHVSRPVLPKPVFGPDLKELLAKLVRLSPADAAGLGPLGTTGSEGVADGRPARPAV